MPAPVNDTRRRPATVAVAVCIGSYARVIFIDGSKQAKVQAAGPKNDLAKHKGSEKTAFASAGLKPYERFDAISFTKHITGHPLSAWLLRTEQSSNCIMNG